MVAHIKTVSFQGLDVQTVDVQVLMTSGLPKVNIVGLPERAVGESKERVRGALASLGLMQPPAHVSINLAPADLSKEGTLFDLPIVLALLSFLHKRETAHPARKNKEQKTQEGKDFLSAQLAGSRVVTTVASGPESTPPARRIVRG